MLCNHIWVSLISIAKENYPKINCFEDFMTIYSETLLRNFVDKLKIIHLLQNSEMPFKLLSSFVLFSEKFAVLKTLDSLLSHVNHHFDRFYLKEDFKTLKLILPIYKITFGAMDDCFKSETERSKQIIKDANCVRRVLMRIKSFVLSNDRHLSFYTLELFRLAVRTLSRKFFIQLSNQ